MTGDLGANPDSTATLNTIAAIGPDAHFVAGDLSYDEITPESAWCDYVHDIVGASMPFEVIAGNHEEDSKVDGFIRSFAACMPDRLGAVGDYGVQYYTDLGGIVRMIGISPDLSIDGRHYRYDPGSSERQWLESSVADAKAQGMWVIVAQHKVCITAGTKSCEIGEELADWLAGNVDVVMMGHDHTYQRSHQLSCVDVNRVTASCIEDNDGDHARGDGAVFVISGLGGRDRAVDRSDSEAGYFAALMGEGDPGFGHGVLRLDITQTTLTARFVGSDTNWTDSFTVHK